MQCPSYGQGMQQLFEMNIRTWCAEQAQSHGRCITLDDIDNSFLDNLVDQGFNWVYLIGVWPTGPLSRKAALQDMALRKYLQNQIPDLTDDDITGSPFAVASFEVDESLGGNEALARLRERARKAGISLMLDFVPNHIGLDHPWVESHPEYCILADEERMRAHPTAYCRIGTHIYAHGRDPFFAPWRNSIQLDYSNPDVQTAMMAVAADIAGRCDGLRCDLAMLLLPDVFENTWHRSMQPFWRRCLDHVRAAHPGTLFMAEVYWNREYELQQSGFDFTFDKILYDRLLAGDAESIRAHLRAAKDFQRHSVRFLENHAEQRAATRFLNPDHYRSALLLTGMVPGMLLCHHGQEEGRRLHASYHCRRRPEEVGSQEHSASYADLMHLLCERARQDGTWHLLEPRYPYGNPLIGCAWTLPGHHALVLVVNASWQPISASVQTGPLGERDLQCQECFATEDVRQISAETLKTHGLQVELPPWGSVVYRIMPAR